MQGAKLIYRKERENLERKIHFARNSLDLSSVIKEVGVKNGFPGFGAFGKLFFEQL
jgi:hypothetical protein